jgi:hypothetical protein
MTDLYWIGIIKLHFVKIPKFEYAAMFRNIERDLYAQYSNGELGLGAQVPINMGRESFLLDIIEDAEEIMKSKYKMSKAEFRELIRDLIQLGREEKINQIFIK